MEITSEQALQARLLARFILVYGEDAPVNSGPAPVTGGRFRYQHMGQNLYTTYTAFVGNRMCSEVYGNRWNTKFWFDGPKVRSMRDVRGRKISEFYRVEHLPFFDAIGHMMHEVKGVLEDETVQFAFWQHTYGKMGRSRIHQSTFNGDAELFERDMLLLKMDERFKTEIGGL